MKHSLFQRQGRTALPALPATVSAMRAGVGKDGADVTSTRDGAVYVPPASETVLHDEDGNRLEDGRWKYEWNAENRLAAVETTPALVAAGAPRQRVEMAYDGGGRRIRKVVKGWNDASNSFAIVSDLRFLYDGWNLIAELEGASMNAPNQTVALRKAFEWGLDVSGTMTRAGGVGGLLVIRSFENKSKGLFAPAYDGNGNVTALVNLNTGLQEARYDYGPFGERVTVEGGAIAEANPYRFSTKYEDAETGWHYYGFRYYSPELGRWPSRDPIGIRGGLNLYGMVGNDPVNRVDYLGWRPALEGKTTEGPTEGECGEFKWVIEFLVSQAASRPNGGQVLQEVNYEWDIDVFLGQKEKSSKSYHETFRVAPGSQSTLIQDSHQDLDTYDKVTDDTFSWKTVPCSKGRVKIVGYARYYPNAGNIFPADWGNAPGSNPSANGLWASPNAVKY